MTPFFCSIYSKVPPGERSMLAVSILSSQLSSPIGCLTITQPNLCLSRSPKNFILLNPTLHPQFVLLTPFAAFDRSDRSFLKHFTHLDSWNHILPVSLLSPALSISTPLQVLVSLTLTHGQVPRLKPNIKKLKFQPWLNLAGLAQ